MLKQIGQDLLAFARSPAVPVVIFWSWWSIFHEIGYLFLNPTGFEASTNWHFYECLALTAGSGMGAMLYSVARRREGVSAWTDKARMPYALSGMLGCVGLAYYGMLVSQRYEGVVVAQLLLSVGSSFFVLFLLRRCEHFGDRRLARALGVAFLLHCLIVYGLFFPLTRGLDPLALAFVHMMLLVFFWASASRLNGTAQVGHDADGEGAWEPKKNMPYGLLIHLVVFGCVFGVLHVVPGGIVHSPSVRIVAYGVGGCLGVALFLSRTKATTFADLWKTICNSAFFLVVVSALVIPILKGGDALGALIVQEAGMNYYTMLIVSIGFVIARMRHARASDMIARGMIIWYASFLGGSVIGIVLVRTTSLDATVFSWLSIVAFSLLFASTHGITSQRNVKTLWGMVDDLPPKRFWDERVMGACNSMAEEYGLTPREREVLVLLALGTKPSEISEQLVISITTVRAHIRKIHQKMAVCSQGEVDALVRATIDRRQC